MSKNKVIRLTVLGAICIFILVAAGVYAQFFNEARWIKQMDLTTYSFILKDIPMLFAGFCLFVYVIYLVFSICKAVCQQKQEEKQDKKYTRRISPYLGLLGFFGFFGFFGFYSYEVTGELFPFAFFSFFGFFGFFFEGKLSHTLQDELYKENEKKAELKAYRVGFATLFVLIWMIGMRLLSSKAEWCAIYMLISVSFVFALVLFLSKFFLYRFEKGA